MSLSADWLLWPISLPWLALVLTPSRIREGMARFFMSDLNVLKKLLFSWFTPTSWYLLDSLQQANAAWFAKVDHFCFPALFKPLKSAAVWSKKGKKFSSNFSSKHLSYKLILAWFTLKGYYLLDLLWKLIYHFCFSALFKPMKSAAVWSIAHAQNNAFF